METLFRVEIPVERLRVAYMTDISTIPVVDNAADSLSLLTGVQAAQRYQVRPINSGPQALASVIPGVDPA